jgi:hypothetical protein
VSGFAVICSEDSIFANASPAPYGMSRISFHSYLRPSPVYDDYMRSPMEDSDSGANADNRDSVIDDVGLEGGQTLGEVFLKLVRFQASYWLDLSLLSRTFGSSDPAYPVPEVFLVAVKHPMHDINLSDSVERLETTLEDLVGFNPDHPINIEEVLAMIEEKGRRMYIQAPYIGNGIGSAHPFSL